jgi:hypothetical protein
MQFLVMVVVGILKYCCRMGYGFRLARNFGTDFLALSRSLRRGTEHLGKL